MTETCELLRDDLPRLAAGGLERADVLRLEAHLATCAACRAELTLVHALRAPLPAPAALRARVRRGRVAPRPRASGFVRYAVAAGVAIVAVGGALVLARGSESARVATGPAAPADAAAELGWAARTDPLLHGGPGLDALSVEELETLLEEMQS